MGVLCYTIPASVPIDNKAIGPGLSLVGSTTIPGFIRPLVMEEKATAGRHKGRVLLSLPPKFLMLTVLPRSQGLSFRFAWRS